MGTVKPARAPARRDSEVIWPRSDFMGRVPSLREMEEADEELAAGQEDPGWSLFDQPVPGRKHNSLGL